MRILILGGTQFIGRHIAETLLAAGHAVSIFNRGRSADSLPKEVERLRGDRDQGVSGLSVLSDRSWDACIDVSGYTPKQVRASAELLSGRVERYVYISAVMAYGDPVQRPVTEDHPLVPPAAEDVTEINGETYGPLKAACDNIVRDIWQDRCTVLRPQVVFGPHDDSGRVEHWLRRAMLGGEMLAPGDGNDHLQMIDVGDVARFVQTVLEQRVSGVFNLAGPRMTWREFMVLIGATDPVWVPADIINAAGLAFNELPLYRQEHGPRASLMDVSSEKAQRAGLTLTDPAISLRDMREWITGRNQPLASSRERERELIAVARCSQVNS